MNDKAPLVTPQPTKRSGKGNGVRSSKHKAYYASLGTRIKTRKDRNVYRSSHGKWRNVAELEAHREKVAKRGGR